MAERSIQFRIEASDTGSRARCGRLTLPHGEVATPIFMPVGTLGGVKSILHQSLRSETGARIVLGNTYHLFLRPGLGVLQRVGGLHRFSSWDGPMLTDSGGFQVFSLAHRRRISDVGVSFQSHVDGSTHLFTPERVINMQRVIGADIIMQLDECPPGDAPYEYAEESLRITENWLERCVQQMERTEPLYGYGQTLFPIVQGGAYLDLRSRSAETAMRTEAGGYAIGGLAVGEPTEVMYSVIEHLDGILPQDNPRYLMGVGTPVNILEAIARGVDMFDCVMPTRNGRNGMLFTWEGMINIRNLKWRNDFTPLDPSGTTSVDAEYSRAYLRHLFVSGELLAGQIASLHNVGFYLELVHMARMHIAAGTFSTWMREVLPKLGRRL